MPLKNYTSSVPAARSISYIETKLAQHKAKQILKTYGDDQRITSICFCISVDGNDMFFKLPAEIKACEKVLLSNLSPRTRPETRKKVAAQAERTAWKILLDWVEAQMAMIELAQVDLMQIFLPYVYSPEKQLTYYEMVKARGFRALLPAGKP